MKLLTKEQMDELLRYFADFVSEIDRYPTSSWKVKINDKGVFITCEVSNRNFIKVPTCVGIMALWNTRHPDRKMVMKEHYCLEDEDRYTTACWKMEWL